MTIFLRKSITQSVLDVIKKAPHAGIFQYEIAKTLKGIADNDQIKGTIYSLKKQGKIQRGPERSALHGYRWLSLDNGFYFTPNPETTIFNEWISKQNKIRGRF